MNKITAKNDYSYTIVEKDGDGYVVENLFNKERWYIDYSRYNGESFTTTTKFENGEWITVKNWEEVIYEEDIDNFELYVKTL